MAFSFLWNEGSFVARDAAGVVTEVDLIFPDDFPGAESLAPDLEVEIESVWLRLVASGTVATRRARVQMFTSSFLIQAQSVSNASAAASQTRQFQFVPGGFVTQAGTVLNLETLPVMVMGQPWTLKVDIQGVAAGDALEDVCVQGRFRPIRRVGSYL